MSFRSVTTILLAAGLLAGCDDFKRTSYEVQRELGMYPVDPPRAETPHPPPGTISQATWTAQRAEVLRGTNQSYVPPVGYKEPEQPAAPGSTPVAAAPMAVTPSGPVAPPLRPPPPVAAARPASNPGANPAAMTPAPVAAAPVLPAGYIPSASVVDQPQDATAQQQMAAATGAQPTPPEAAKMGPEPPMMSGSMKEGAAMMAGTWKAHLASHRTESAAINEWQELLKSNAALYGQFDPLVEWTDTQRGPFARLVLVGFAERKDADAACAKLRSSTRYCASVQ